MSENTKIAAPVALPERQESRLSDSSGSGSGAGYSADYESSESSLSSKQKNGLQQLEENSNRSTNQKDTASMNTGVRHHRKKKSGEHASDNKSMSSLDNANKQLQALLPQWNGIRITHPMDPRIDLSTVGYTVNTNAGALPASYMMAPHTAPHSSSNSNSVDHYHGLMEAVKPFFGDYTPVANPLAEREPYSDQAPNTGESEGFTAFFTTTNSNTGTTNTTSSDSNSDPNAIQNRQARAASQKDDETEASVSSMVALSRVKRKHKKRQHEQDGTSPSSSSGSEQRPQHGIHDSAEHALQQPELGENDETGPPQQPQQARRQESSSSFSSDEQQQQFPIPLPRQPLDNDIRADVNNVPLPLVSESSDARQNNGFSSQSNATASGSGSNENSGISNKGSSGSGSGSNNGGSSGSGNEEKGDVCGGNSNSDENNKVIEPAVAAAVGEPMLGIEQEANDDGSTREDRLMDKKRKRMDMRREYELDMNSSGSDDQEASSVLPGKPVTLDAALSFSRTARIVIQASPPFLVVHANAAFTRLTGVDSHEVNGRSISNLFTIPSKKGSNGGAQSHQAAAAAGRARALEETNVERLVIANGFDDYHLIQVAAKLQDVDDQHCDSVQCLMSVSPIVAQTMPPPAEAPGVVTDTNQGSHHHKKRKHHHHQEGEKNASTTHRHTKPPPATNPVITHYMIQLEAGDVKRSALTSDGDVLMSKLEQAQPRDQGMLNDNEAGLEESSHSTDPKEPVEAVG